MIAHATPLTPHDSRSSNPWGDRRGSVCSPVLRDNLMTHLLAMKAFGPLLAPRRGAYVPINRFIAEERHLGAAATATAQKALALSAEDVGDYITRMLEQHDDGVLDRLISKPR